MDATTSLLLALVLFQAKHFLADFVFQTPWMLREKGDYGKPGGIAHAVVHAGFSVPALLALGLSGPLLLTVIFAELVAHYHIDWIKETATKSSAATPRDKSYWVFVGMDQGAHQLTYVAMTAVALLTSML